MPCKLINAEMVKELLTMKDTVAACEDAFDGWGKGEVICPTKITLELGEDAEWPPYKNGLNAMPAYIHSKKSAGIKCVGGSLNNPSWGLPYIIALILLFDRICILRQQQPVRRKIHIRQEENQVGHLWSRGSGQDAVNGFRRGIRY